MKDAYDDVVFWAPDFGHERLRFLILACGQSASRQKILSCFNRDALNQQP